MPWRVYAFASLILSGRAPRPLRLPRPPLPPSSFAWKRLGNNGHRLHLVSLAIFPPGSHAPLAETVTVAVSPFERSRARRRRCREIHSRRLSFFPSVSPRLCSSSPLVLLSLCPLTSQYPVMTASLWCCIVVLSRGKKLGALWIVGSSRCVYPRASPLASRAAGVGRAPNLEATPSNAEEGPRPRP